MTSECLICLAPVTATENSVSCPNKHVMHTPCMLAMLVKMGKDRCPYCLKSVTTANGKFPRTSLPKRVVILMEHAVYEIILIGLFMFSLRYRPRVWRLNRSVALLRLRYEFLEEHLDALLMLRQWACRMMLCFVSACIVSALERYASARFGYFTDMVMVVLYVGVILRAVDWNDNE